jgi:hypothetical protein
MEMESLAKVLTSCLSVNTEERRYYEAMLSTYQTIPNFSTELLKISSERNYENSVRQLAAISLKNFISQNWKENRISKEEKENIKILLISSLPNVNANKPISKSYIEVLRVLLKNDLPTWNGLPSQISELLSSPHIHVIQTGLIIFYQICKQYQFQLEEKKEPYIYYLCNLLPSIETFLDQIMTSISQTNLLTVEESNQGMIKILYLILKIYLCSISVI